MTDPHGDPPDDLGNDLRRVLGRGSAARSGTDPDALLARVRTGARRRRARRAAGVVLAGAAAAASVVAVAVPFADQGDQVPAASSPPPGETADSSTLAAAPGPVEPGTAVEPTDVRVRAVTAASREEFWVLGEATCDGGDCLVVGHTDKGAEAPFDFRTAPGTTGADVTMRMAGNGRDGWLVSEGELHATHDSADTWKPVRPPMAQVEDVVTSAASVWVTGSDRQGKTVVATADAEDDTFTDTGLPPGLADTVAPEATVLTGDDQGRRFGFLRTVDGTAEFVVYAEYTGEWETYGTHDCDAAGSLSSTSEALWALCERDGTYSPMVSADAGKTWDLVELDMSLGDQPRIAAVDEDTAFLSTGFGLYVLNGDELLPADPGPEGAGTKTYEFLGFNDDQTGFLIDTDGVLSYSTNAGASWEPVELP